MNNRNIHLGDVERPFLMGALRRWEPLRLDWSRCRSHFLVKSDQTSGWTVLAKQIIESVLAQNGRVLVIDRRDPTISEAVQGDLTELSTMRFLGRQFRMIESLDDETILDGFFNARQPCAEEKRLMCIPPSVSLSESQDHTPDILTAVQRSLWMKLGAPMDLVDRKTMEANQMSWDDAAPVVVLSLGFSWIEQCPSITAQLRAMSVSMIHVMTRGYGVSAMTAANTSGGFLELSGSGDSKKQVIGMIRYVEPGSPARFDAREITTLFKLDVRHQDQPHT